VLGVDLGSRRIGVAVTDSGQTVATGVATVARSGDRAADHRALARLVAEYEAVGVVIGVPLSLSGKVGPAASAALTEIGEIRALLGVEVMTEDERLTSRVAAGALRAGGYGDRNQRAVIDQSAAAVFLQTWIERRMSAGRSLSGR
jgi:putative Holliday junction resolvase